MTEENIENIENNENNEDKPAKRTSNETLAKMRKDNPGVKFKRLKNGGIQIVNPRAPSPLLNNLINRATK